MRSLASGLLREINVTEGKHVQKGEVLVQLDPTISQSEVDRLKKLSQQSRATLARLQAERTGNTQAGSLLQNQLLAARLQEFRDRRAAAEAEANRQLNLIKTAWVHGNDSCKKGPYALEKNQFSPKLLINQASHQFY